MPKTKLFILTGFLGSGKTTMLLKLLDAMKGHKIGIIQNEFGKISIDGDIIRENEDVKMVEISRGSIFCTCLKLNFVQTLAEMSGMGFEYLFVESSGMGDPSNLEEIMNAVAAIKGTQPYDLRGTICLIDAVDFLRDAAELESVRRQVIHCNIALVNKCDLVDRAKLDEVIAEVRKLNDSCLVVESVMGAMDPAILEQDLSGYNWAPFEETTNSAETRPKTFSLEFTESIPKAGMDAFLRDVLADCFRIKGFALLDGAWTQVDVVGDRIDYKSCDPLEKAQLVFISRTGIQLIRTLSEAWEKNISLPVKFRN